MRRQLIKIQWEESGITVGLERKMAITQLEKRFGALAVEKGFITLEQLIKAMNIQIFENLQEGKHRLIGDILFEKGFITKRQIEEVLGSLGKWASPTL